MAPPSSTSTKFLTKDALNGKRYPYAAGTRPQRGSWETIACWTAESVDVEPAHGFPDQHTIDRQGATTSSCRAPLGKLLRTFRANL
jgi:hypothetical protein